MTGVRRRLLGQGLVEFALLLPLLMLILVGTIEFGRVMFIYVNIANAAREGARYGMVNPKDQNGIINNVTETLQMVTSNDITMNITYDKGPDTTTVPASAVAAGDRVIITIEYTVQPITPLMQPFMPGGMLLRTENRRTIQTSRADAASTLAAPAPPPIPPTHTATPAPSNVTRTSTPRPSATVPNTMTSTNTPGPTSTLSPSPTSVPATATATPLPGIDIDAIWAEDTVVTGHAAAGYGVTLRVVQTGFQRSVAVGADGRFSFSGLPEMVAGYTVVVQGYGQQAFEIVRERPTPTPSLTPTPGNPYVFVNLSAPCLEPGVQTVTVSGRQWPVGGNPVETVRFLWNGQPFSPEKTVYHNGTASFDVQVQVNLTVAGPNRIGAEGYYHWNKGGSQRLVQPLVEAVIPVCNATPTPTATPTSLPDLVISNLVVTDDPLPGTYERIRLVASVHNAGVADVTSLFWVDLFADADLGVPLAQQASVDYVAVGALGAGSTISFTMYVPTGFEAVGAHTLVAMVDTWNQVFERDEDNNLSTVQAITLSVANSTPTPTPIVTPGPTGDLGGITSIGALPQGFVMLYLYDDEDRLVASGRSDGDGLYEMADIPVGDYVIMGQLRLGNVVYLAVQPVIVTDSGYTVANLYLSEL